jgi:hypothetical protein
MRPPITHNLHPRIILAAAGMTSEPTSARVKDPPCDEERELDLTLRPTRINEYMASARSRKLTST